MREKRKTLKALGIHLSLGLCIVLGTTTSSRAELTLDGITSTVSEIDSAIGEVNSAIDSLGSYDINTLFEGLNIDSQMSACLVQDETLASLSSASSPLSDGVCGLVNLPNFSISTLFDDKLASCLGVEATTSKEITQLEERLQKTCGTIESSVKEGEDYLAQSLGSTTSSDVTYASGGKVYSPMGNFVSNVESDGVSGGVKVKGSDTPLEDKKYPSGLTVKEIYGGDGGGKLTNKYITHPDSEEAQALKTNNKTTLLLKQMALKLNGTMDESTIHLPPNMLSVIQDENDVANFIALSVVDYRDLENQLISYARERFKRLDAPSLDAYRIKEQEDYFKMVQEDTKVKELISNIKSKAMSAIGNYYHLKLVELQKSENYLPDVSYTIERLTKDEAKDDFKYLAMLQMNDEVLIKAQEAKEKRKVNMEIDAVVNNSYYKASIFRSDIAKKEIDAILKSVDTAIK